MKIVIETSTLQKSIFVVYSFYKIYIRSGCGLGLFCKLVQNQVLAAYSTLLKQFKNGMKNEMK